MKEIVDYANSGRPIIGLRTGRIPSITRSHPDSPYAKYSWNNKEFEGGFGRQIMGETWVRHWGQHQKQSTRGVVAPGDREPSDSERSEGRLGTVGRLRNYDLDGRQQAAADGPGPEWDDAGCRTPDHPSA